MKSRQSGEWRSESLTVLPNNRRYLIGVSGGRDSAVLLHWLLAHGYRKLIICHFEHGLRGRAGKADARFVARLAAKDRAAIRAWLGGCRGARRAPEAIDRNRGASGAARLFSTNRPTPSLPERSSSHIMPMTRSRLFCLIFFAALVAAASARCGRDQASVHLRSFVRCLMSGAPRLTPMFGCTGLQFRDDATNEKLEARRNRIRHKIIPGLEKEFGRNIRKTIWRTAALFAEEEDYLESLLPVDLTNQSHLTVSKVGALPVALQRRDDSPLARAAGHRRSRV